MNKFKKYFGLLLVFAMIFTACRQEAQPGQETPTPSPTVEVTPTAMPTVPPIIPAEPLTDGEIEEKLKNTVHYLVIGMGENWDSGTDSAIYNLAGTGIFRRVLEILYERETGLGFPNDKGITDLKIYVDLGVKHFPLTEEQVAQLLYDEDLPQGKAYMSDGLGNVADAELTRWNKNGNIITANYDYSTPLAFEDGFLIRKGVLTIEVNADNSFKFLSNTIEPRPEA